MSSKVMKPFNTTNRRFKAGDDFTEVDAAGQAMTLQDLQDGGFVDPAQDTPKTHDGDATGADNKE